MRSRTLAISVSAGAAWLALVAFSRAPIPASADSINMPNTGLADPATLRHLYDQWRAGGGGGSAISLPLISFAGLSNESVQATGEVQVDTAAGRINSQVFGLPAGDWELWLVDNARNTSTLPGDGDRVISAGRYRPAAEGRRHVLETALPDNRPEGFEIDRVALTRAGRNPSSDGFVLLGGANLYERLARRMVRDKATGTPVESPDEWAALVAAGRTLFHNETFQGNGRRCGTCHVESNNFTIDAALISGLSPADPLFVHERSDELARNFESPQALRRAGLILGNPDGADDLAGKFVVRSVQPLQAIGTQIKAPTPEFFTDFTVVDPAANPPERLGWGNDALPLREFAIGAIIQHGPRTLARRNGVDFRLPSDEELDAIAAYVLSIGRQEDFDLTKLKLNSPAAMNGLKLYTDTGMLGEPGHKNCNSCHFNGGGTGAYSFNPGAPGFSPKLDALPRGFNVTTGTNVNGFRSAPEGLTIPRDGGFGSIKLPTGSFGNFGVVPGGPVIPVEEFNSMSLVESADTAPYFHNHAVATLEEAIAFYGTKAYQSQESIGDPVAGPIPVKISDNPKDPEVQAIATFLRVLNALENIRSAMSALRRARLAPALGDGKEIAALAREEVIDGFEVLSSGSLAANPDFVILIARTRLTAARASLEAARNARNQLEFELAFTRAMESLGGARAVLADERTLPPSFQR